MQIDIHTVYCNTTMGSSTHSDNESVYSNDPPSIASRGNNDDASSTGAQSLLSSLAELPSKAKRRQMKQSRARERSNSKQRDADGNHVRSRSRHNTRKDPEYNDESSTVASNTIASESIFTANIVEEGRSSSHRNNRSSSHRSSSSKRHKKKKELCTTNCSPLNICSGVHIKTLIFCILGTTAIMKLTSNPPLINTSHGISSGGSDNSGLGSDGLGSTVYGGESMGRDLKSNLRGSSTVSDVLDIDGVVKPTYNDGSDEEEGDSEDKDEDEEEEGSGDKEENEDDTDELKEAFDPPEDITESQQEQFNQQLGSLGTPIEQKPNSLMSSPAANSLLQSDVPPPPPSTEDVVGTARDGEDSVQEEGSTLQEGATLQEGGGFTSQLQLPQLATTTQQQQTGFVGSDPLLAVQPQLAGQAPVLGADGTVQSPLTQQVQVQGGAAVNSLGQTQTSLLQPQQQQFVLPGSAPVQQQQDASSQLQQLQISPTGGLTPSSTGGGVDVNAAQQRLDEHASNGFDVESAQAKLKKLQDLQAQLAARQAAQQQQQQMVPASGVAGVASPLSPSLSGGGDAAEPLAQSATITQEQQVAPPVDTAGSSLGAFDPTLFQPPVDQQQVPEVPSGGGEFAAPSVQQDVPTTQEQAAVASGGGLEQPAVSSEVAAPTAEFDPFRPV